MGWLSDLSACSRQKSKHQILHLLERDYCSKTKVLSIDANY